MAISRNHTGDHAIDNVGNYVKEWRGMINTVKDYEKLSEQYNKMLAERNSLIDDLSWYKAKVSRLERENKDLRLQSDTYFEQWQQHKALNNEISQHIGNKPSSSTYKYFRAKLDDLNITEDE